MEAIEEVQQTSVADEYHSGGELQYLTFMLGEESYGIEILRVQEIRGWEPVTTVPNTPSYVRGVLNLRGNIIPVIDLRLKFQLSKVEFGKTTVIIVVEVGDRVLGAVVDAVSEVLSIAQTSIQESESIGSIVGAQMLSGIAKCEERLVSLLDVEKVLALR